MSRFRFILFGTAVIFVLIMLFVFPSSRQFILNLYTQQGLETIKNYILAVGFWGPLASIFLMVLHTIIFIPSEIILFANVYTFGFYLGILYTWVGSMLGAYLSFYLARLYGRPFVDRFISKGKVRQFDDWLEKKGVFGFFLLRLVPLFSFNLLNYSAGLTKISVWQFTWSTGIGILPPTIVMAWLYENAVNNSLGILILMLSAIGILSIKLYNNKRKKDV